MRQKGSAASRCSAVAWIPKATEAFGIKNLAPAQDVDLPLPYPQLEHLVGEDRGVDDGGPRSDLKLAFWCAIGGKSAAGRISRGSRTLPSSSCRIPPMAKK